MWYIVLIDNEGDQDRALEFDRAPTEQEWHDAAQTVGYLYSGIYIAKSPEDAIRAAYETFNGSGCVA